MRDVPIITLTGGPCGGKTTALPFLQQKLGDRGWYPLVIPEAPTHLMRSNLTPKSGAFTTRTFQRSVIQLLRDQLEIFYKAAQECAFAKPIIICDRLYPDTEQYCESGKMYEELLRELDIGSRVEARDKYCKGVFHLITAANGAEEFYTKANNEVRLEDPEGARLADEHTLWSWVGHPHLRILDNSTDFAGKLGRLDQEVCSLLGIPVPLEIERKYLCAPVDVVRIPVPVQTVEIEQVYIASDDPAIVPRIRKRGQWGSFLYYRTEKKFIRPGVNVEQERFITGSEYHHSLALQLPRTRVIKKHRHCFVYEHQYFELDTIPVGSEIIHMLEIEMTEENREPVLPPFIRIEREVTHDRKYTNRALADLDWPHV